MLASLTTIFLSTCSRRIGVILPVPWHSAEKAQSAGAAAVPDAALLAWLHRDALIEKLEQEIDRAANDKAALSAAERAEATADVQRQLLEIERQEAVLVWRGIEQGLPSAPARGSPHWRC